MGENGDSCVAKSAQELLVDFQATGRQASFEEIARRYAGMVYNVALRVTRDGHDAEDATQATFLTLAETLNRGTMISHAASSNNCCFYRSG